MTLLAVIKEPANVARHLAAVAVNWKSRVLRRHVLDGDEGGGRNGSRAGEVA